MVTRSRARSASITPKFAAAVGQTERTLFRTFRPLCWKATALRRRARELPGCCPPGRRPEIFPRHVCHIGDPELVLGKWAERHCSVHVASGFRNWRQQFTKIALDEGVRELRAGHCDGFSVAEFMVDGNRNLRVAAETPPPSSGALKAPWRHLPRSAVPPIRSQQHSR